MAAATLKECPGPFLETAIDVVQAGGLLVDKVASELRPVDDDSYDEVCGEAKSALSSFVDHLRTLEADEATHDFAIGEDAFNFRLQYEHGLRMVASEVWRYGHRLIEDTDCELRELADEISPGVQWPDLVDRLRRIHPPLDEVIKVYMEEMERARDFVEERSLVTIPDGRLEVVATPDFLRPLIPFAAYQPPGAFSDDKSGWFYVTPPPGDVADDDLERAMRDHCTYEIACTSLHEGVPGHHLQFLRAQAREVFDVTGAGDTVIATLAGAVASGQDLASAAALANIAAGLVVRKIGVATVTPGEISISLHQRGQGGRGLVGLDELKLMVAESHDRGERVIMTNGCFDVLHAGHVSYLEEAKSLGDRLIVAVNDDASVRRLKGESRPVNKLEDRLLVLAGLAAVDWVVPFPDDTPASLIAELLPDVLVKGGDYKPDDIAGAKDVLQNGGEVRVLAFRDGHSSSRIIDKLRD